MKTQNLFGFIKKAGGWWLEAGGCFSRLIKPFLLQLIFISITTFSYSQDSSDYFNPLFLRYENHVYRPAIKTVVLERLEIPLSDPVIQLNSSEQLQLTFDELTDEIHDFSYKWIHCDANWQPSRLLSESDYTDGFYEDHIVNYRHSFNAIDPYYHFTLTFPNEQMKPLISGNYLLVVFETGDPEKPVLSQRFWVFENKTDIQVNVHRATEIELRNSHQEIDFKLQVKDYKINNPYADIRVTIVQNNRWDAAITDLKPLYVMDGVYDYNYEEGNVFEGGNEFRNFDLRSTRFQTQFIDSIVQHPLYHTYDIYLKPSLRRGTQRYSTEEDLNGRYLIKIYDDRDGNLEADYVKVHFTLPVMEESDSGSYYIYGQLTDWNLVPWARMEYNEVSGNYEQTLVLKQGFYNYEYVFLPGSSSKSVVADTEGNHYETLNSYYFYIYWKDQMNRYDRLIGFRRSDSNIH